MSVCLSSGPPFLAAGCESQEEHKQVGQTTDAPTRPAVHRSDKEEQPGGVMSVSEELRVTLVCDDREQSAQNFYPVVLLFLEIPSGFRAITGKIREK